MGNDVSRGFNAVGNTLKEGLSAWFDPTKRGVILGQVKKALPTLHEDLQRVSAEHSPALGLVSQIGSGLIKTVPVAQLAEKVLGNVANGNVGGLVGNALEAKMAKPGAYTGEGMSRADLLKGVANEITNSEKNKSRAIQTTSPAQMASVPAPAPEIPRPSVSASKEPKQKVKPAVKKSSKSRDERFAELFRE
jgi:hypothetical protein